VTSLSLSEKVSGKREIRRVCRRAGVCACVRVCNVSHACEEDNGRSEKLHTRTNMVGHGVRAKQRNLEGCEGEWPVGGWGVTHGEDGQRGFDVTTHAHQTVHCVRVSQSAQRHKSNQHLRNITRTWWPCGWGGERGNKQAVTLGVLACTDHDSVIGDLGTGKEYLHTTDTHTHTHTHTHTA
jgi:hypothetical protein